MSFRNRFHFWPPPSLFVWDCWPIWRNVGRGTSHILHIGRKLFVQFVQWSINKIGGIIFFRCDSVTPLFTEKHGFPLVNLHAIFFSSRDGNSQRWRCRVPAGFVIIDWTMELRILIGGCKDDVWLGRPICVDLHPKILL